MRIGYALSLLVSQGKAVKSGENYKVRG